MAARSSERGEQAKNEGHYFESHVLQALAIETAEAWAKSLHRRIREDWGFPDPPEMTMAPRWGMPAKTERGLQAPAIWVVKSMPLIFYVYEVKRDKSLVVQWAKLQAYVAELKCE